MLGSDAFASAMTRGLEPYPEVPRQHTHPVRPTLEQIFQRHAGPDAMAAAYRHHDYTLRDIAGHVGCHYATISRRLRAHEQRPA